MTKKKKEKADKNKIALFQGKRVRKVLLNDEWYFSVIDVVDILTESASSRRYWSDLKRKLKKEGYNQLHENIVQLKMSAPDGKLRQTDCANIETMFRIIQSIPSKKAEPFKQLLNYLIHRKIYYYKFHSTGVAVSISLALDNSILFTRI